MLNHILTTVGKDTATLSELRAQAPAFSILIATESKQKNKLLLWPF
jgi:hypothetical protein